MRAIFELQYQPWNAPGLRVTETKRIAIDAGQNLNHVTSIFRAENGGPDIPWATGLVKRKNVIGLESKANAWAWLTSGDRCFRKTAAMATWASRMLLPRASVLDWKETNDHYLAISRANPASR